MTIHETILQASRATCALCGTGPCGCGGVHLARIARARADGLITAEDFAAVIADADVFTGSTVVLDPEAQPAAPAELAVPGGFRTGPVERAL